MITWVLRSYVTVTRLCHDIGSGVMFVIISDTGDTNTNTMKIINIILMFTSVMYTKIDFRTFKSAFYIMNS